MSLSNLLGLRPTIGGMGLAKYMGAVSRGEIERPAEHDGLAGFMPTPPAQPVSPKPDPVEAALAQQRQDRQLQDAHDREAMLAHLKARRVGRYSNPQPGELEREHKINRRMDAAIAALGGSDD